MRLRYGIMQHVKLFIDEDQTSYKIKIEIRMDKPKLTDQQKVIA